MSSSILQTDVSPLQAQGSGHEYSLYRSNVMPSVANHLLTDLVEPSAAFLLSLGTLVAASPALAATTEKALSTVPAAASAQVPEAAVDQATQQIIAAVKVRPPFSAMQSRHPFLYTKEVDAAALFKGSYGRSKKPQPQSLLSMDHFLVFRSLLINRFFGTSAKM